MKGRWFLNLLLILWVIQAPPSHSPNVIAAAQGEVPILRGPALTGPDLAISAETIPAQVNAKEPLDTWLHVTNLGPGIATGVVLTGLADNASLELSYPSQGWCDAMGGITCTLGTLVEGSHADLHLRFLPSAAGTFSNQAAVYYNLTDPNSANDSLTQSASVLPALNKIYVPVLMRNWQRSEPQPPIIITPTAVVTLTLNQVGIVPTGTVGLNWQVGGDVTGQGLYLQALTPGQGYTTTAELPYLPGSAPANGDRYYLTPELTWVVTPTIYLSPAASGAVTVTLPVTDTGQWRLEARLGKDEDDIASWTSVPLLCSDVPAIALLRSQSIANTWDPLRFELLTSTGAMPKNVKIAALLTLNDGSQVSLPSFAPGLEWLYTGPAQDAHYTLLDSDLSFYGEGSYQLEVRMYISETMQLAGFAQAGLQISNRPAVISGTVFDPLGQPLGGGNPSMALVSALDIASGAAWNVPIASSGTYSMSLVPGAYRLSAKILDSNGWHTAEITQPVSVGWQGLAQTVNLTAISSTTASVANTANAAGAPIFPAFHSAYFSLQAAEPVNDADATDNLPKPKVLIFNSTITVLRLTGRQFTGIIADLLQEDEPNLEIYSHKDIQALFRYATSNLENPDMANVLGSTLKFDYIISLSIQLINGGDERQITLSLVDPYTGAVLRRATSSRYAWDASEQVKLERLTEVEQLMDYDRYDASGQRNLFDKCRANQDRPLFPQLQVRAQPTEATVGSTVRLTLSLTDGNGDVAARKPVDILYWPVGHNNQSPVIFSGQTDADGKWIQIITTNAPPGLVKFDGRYVRPQDLKVFCIDGSACIGGDSFRVLAPSDLQLTSPVAELHEGETRQACARLTHNGAPVANANINLSATGGSAPASVTTDQNGRKCFDLLAGTSDANTVILNATAALTPTSSSRASWLAQSSEITSTISFLLDHPLELAVSAEPDTLFTNQTSAISVTTHLGADLVPGLPVQFNLQGEGTLSDFTTHTDAHGQAQVTYLAPDSGEGVAVIQAFVDLEGTVVTSTTSVSYSTNVCHSPGIGSYCAKILPPPNNYFAVLNDGSLMYLTDDLHVIKTLNGEVTDTGTLPPEITIGPIVVSNDDGDIVGYDWALIDGVFQYIWGLHLGNDFRGQINNAHQIPVGHYLADHIRPAIWQNGVYTDLSDPNIPECWEQGFTAALAINNSGQVVGSASYSIIEQGVQLCERVPVTWVNGEIGEIPGFRLPAVISAEARQINDSGSVLVFAENNDLQVMFALNGSWIIPPTNCAIQERTVILNNLDTLVGWLEDNKGPCTATDRVIIYQNGLMTGLNSLVNLPSGGVIDNVIDLNDNGYMLANSNIGQVLLIPTGQPIP